MPLAWLFGHCCKLPLNLHQHCFNAGISSVFCSPLCHPRHFFLAPLFTFFTLDDPGHLACLQAHRLRLMFCLPALCDSRFATFFLQILLWFRLPDSNEQVFTGHVLGVV
eukprot:s240_g5.t1